MKKAILFILIISFFISCNEAVQKELNLIEKKKYLNYLKAIRNGSTVQNFLVIKVKNLNNGETREYCAKGNFLWGALKMEMNANHAKNEYENVYEMVRKNKERYFEFKSDSALWNISAFCEYSMKELSEYENQIKIDSLVYRIENGKDWGITIKNDNEMRMCAHALFNKGILTAENSCFGGMLLLDKTR